MTQLSKEDLGKLVEVLRRELGEGIKEVWLQRNELQAGELDFIQISFKGDALSQISLQQKADTLLLTRYGMKEAERCCIQGKGYVIVINAWGVPFIDFAKRVFEEEVVKVKTLFEGLPKNMQGALLLEQLTSALLVATGVDSQAAVPKDPAEIVAEKTA